MTRDELRSTVLEALGNIAPDADVAHLAPDRDLREALDIDSMDFLNFMVAIHEATGVEVPERDYGKLSTLDAALDYLLPKLGKTGA
jgi:acyl carrier protein